MECTFCHRVVERDEPIVARQVQSRGPSPSSSSSSSFPLALVVGAVVLLLGVVGVFALRGSSGPKPPPSTQPGDVPPPPKPPIATAATAATVATVATVAPPKTVSPAQPTSPTAGSSPPPGIEAGAVTLTWKARLSASTGAAPPVGTACTLSTTVTSNGDRVRHSLLFVCAGKTLYDSRIPLEGMSNNSYGLVEALVTGQLDAFAYALKASDVGARNCQTGQIQLSTLDREINAFSDAIPSFRVKAVVDKLTEPRRGLPLFVDSIPPFSKPVARKLKVTTRKGKVPFAGASCDLRVVPGHATKERCRALVTCGGKVVFGSELGGFVQCNLEGDAPIDLRDDAQTPTDGDPAMVGDLKAGTLTLSDTLADGADYSVSFEIMQ